MREKLVGQKLHRSSSYIYCYLVIWPPEGFDFAQKILSKFFRIHGAIEYHADSSAAITLSECKCTSLYVRCSHQKPRRESILRAEPINFECFLPAISNDARSWRTRVHLRVSNMQNATFPTRELSPLGTVVAFTRGITIR